MLSFEIFKKITVYTRGKSCTFDTKNFWAKFGVRLVRGIYQKKRSFQCPVIGINDRNGQPPYCPNERSYDYISSHDYARSYNLRRYKAIIMKEVTTKDFIGVN